MLEFSVLRVNHLLRWWD